MLTLGAGAINLDELVQIEPAFASNPGALPPADPGYVDHDLDLDLLGIELPLADGIDIAPGTKLSDLLTIGVGGQMAKVGDDDTALGASGVVNGQGLVSVGGTPPDTPTKLTLNPLLNAAGLDSLVEDVSLEVKAVSGQASAEPGADPEGKYDLVGTTLTIKSKAVGDLTKGLQTTVGGLGDTLNGLIGDNAAITQGLNGLLDGLKAVLNPVLAILGGSIQTGDGVGVTVNTDLDANLAPLLKEPLTSENGAVAINLEAGTISVNLDALMDDPDSGLPGLNNMDPNTALLSGPVLNEIIRQVTDLVGGEDGLTGKVDDILQSVLGSAEVDIQLPLAVKLLGATLADIGISVNSTVGQLIGWDDTPLTADDITVKANIAGIPLGAILQPVVQLLVKDLIPAIGGPLKPLVQGLLNDTVSTVLQPLIKTVTDGINPLLTAISENLLAVTVNKQETVGNGDFLHADGDDSRAFTERALYVSLLPKVSGGEGLLSLGLGNATVIGEPAAEPTITASPASGAEGDEIGISGGGFSPNSAVAVTIGGVPAGTVQTDADGNIAEGATVTVPEGVDVGETTLVGTEGENTAETPFEVTEESPGDANVNASASASASATADNDSNASAQVAAQAAADADANDTASAAADSDATAAASAAAQEDASSTASADVTSEANAAAQAAAAASSDATADSAQDADASAAQDANASAAASAAAETDASTDASSAAAADADGTEDATQDAAQDADVDANAAA
ncbi:MAG: choice-of-anchor G family protein, partial [Galactobacter sp.]